MGLNTFPCNPYPISTEELNKGNNDALNTRVTALEGDVSTLEGDVSDLNSNKANQITIAPIFNAETAYEVGDLVYYNGLSYRCTNAHQGEWDADDFAATTISNELSSLMSGLNGIQRGEIFGTFDNVTNIALTVNLPRSMPSANYSVAATIVSGNSDYRFFVSTFDRTASSFRLMVTSDDKQAISRDVTIQWIAMAII